MRYARSVVLGLLMIGGCSRPETPAQQATARLARAEAAMEACKRSVGLGDVATPTRVVLDDPATRAQEMTTEMAGQLRLKIQCRRQLDELLAARRPQ
jgi:crotonobetainyl-CoA:carnitine CoA-transferase CaiB-like acyl-CoA transferase